MSELCGICSGPYIDIGTVFIFFDAHIKAVIIANGGHNIMYAGLEQRASEGVHCGAGLRCKTCFYGGVRKTKADELTRLHGIIEQNKDEILTNFPEIIGMRASLLAPDSAEIECKIVVSVSRILI